MFAAGVQYPDDAAVQAKDRRGQAGELASLLQVMLLADKKHRIALGQDATRRGGAHVLFRDLRTDTEHLIQLAVVRAESTQAAEHHAFQIEAGQHPVFRRQGGVQLLHLRGGAGQQQAIAFGDLRATGNHWRVKQQIVARAQAVVLRALPGSLDHL
ncbi:hypothetical protein D3C81_1380460 [compost metagenome]